MGTITALFNLVLVVFIVSTMLSAGFNTTFEQLESVLKKWQPDFIRGEDESNREYFHMFFDKVHVGLRWRNFKVLTHLVENGTAPIQKLATPHIYNLTVNPDESTPYNYPTVHSWMLYEIYGPLARQLMASLAEDSVPSGAPVDYDPNASEEPDHPLLEKLGEFFHAR